MNTVLIAYDLRAPGRNYQPVYDYLQAHSQWCHLQESVWLVRTSLNASQIRDALRQLVDDNDHLATFVVTGDDWAASSDQERLNWMYSYMGGARAFV